MIFVHINVNDPFARRISVYSHELNVNKEISVEFSDENGAINLDDYTVTATFVCNKFFITDEVVVKKESQTGVVKLDIGSTDSYTILPGEMLIEFRIAKSNQVIYPVTAMVVDVYPSIKDDAQVTPQSYGTVAEILQEVAEARGNYNNLNARLDNIELNKMTFTNLGTVSSYDESIFQNNKNTGTVYAVNMSGTSYWFFNVKIGTDVSIQYRFSKNGIEVYNTVLQEWMNIGGKGGEIVTARKTFSTLGLRLDSIDSALTSVNSDINDIESEISDLVNDKTNFTDLGTLSTYDESVFQNNKATGTVYAVNMEGTSYWFFNVKIGTDVSIQYRFSKNGIEVYNTVLQEWMNIGGKGDEVVAARGGFADLDARLDDMGHDIETLIVEVNQGIPSDLAGKMNVKTATGSPDTAFDNNLDLQTVYHVGIKPNQYHFVNLDDSTQLRYNANLGFELREKENDTWGEWTPAIADGSITSNMLSAALKSAVTLANHSMQYKFLGNVSGSDEASAFADNTDPKYIYRVGARGTYYDFINLSSDIQCRLSKFGVELRKKTNDTWGNWTYLVEENDRSKLLQMWADFDTKDYLDVVDLGELGETTSLDNEDYCLESRRYLFKAVNNLAGILHVPANTVCVLTNANGYQIVEPVNIAVKIIRKVNAVRPTFNADPWEFITKTLNSGEVLWDNLAVPVKTRITDLESGVTDLASGKLDYIDDSDNTIWTTAALNSYDFDSDKLYQVMLNGKILGAYEPAQIALVFQSDSYTRIIIGAKSGVFYSTYDSQTEEWSDPVKSLDKATERQLNNFEQRISALETANTILSNAINGVVS